MGKINATKIIEDELKILGEKVENETRENVRVSLDTFDKDGGQINEGGSLRDSILSYAKGKVLKLSQLNYGKWQKPKELGVSKWSPPSSPNSNLWDNPLATSIAKNVPASVNAISKSLIKNIVAK